MIDAKKLFDAIRQIKGTALTQDDVRLINGVILQSAEAGPRKTGPQGLALIKQFEGLVLKAYPDPATGAEPWTIGYGHTGGVKPGQVVTEAQADALLSADLARFEDAVGRLCPITTQTQFDALVSFAFNLGPANLEKSTLRQLHNAGNYVLAQQEFRKWNKAAGQVMTGLTRRRAAEAALYGSAS